MGRLGPSQHQFCHRVYAAQLPPPLAAAGEATTSRDNQRTAHRWDGCPFLSCDMTMAWPAHGEARGGCVRGRSRKHVTPSAVCSGRPQAHRCSPEMVVSAKSFLEPASAGVTARRRTARNSRAWDTMVMSFEALMEL